MKTRKNQARPNSSGGSQKKQHATAREFALQVPPLPEEIGDTKFVSVWMPVGLVELLDRAARQLDSGRSKFIRAAVREKLDRQMIPLSNQIPSSAHHSN